MEMEITTNKTDVKVGGIPVKEMRSKTVKPVGNSGHVVLPQDWIGKKVIIILPIEEDKTDD